MPPNPRNGEWLVRKIAENDANVAAWLEDSARTLDNERRARDTWFAAWQRVQSVCRAYGMPDMQNADEWLVDQLKHLKREEP